MGNTFISDSEKLSILDQNGVTPTFKNKCVVIFLIK